MSYSSLWVIDNNYNGEELYEYKNSWLLSPVVFDVLYEKYLPEEIFNKAMGYKKNFISESMFDRTLPNRLNDKINDSTIRQDRAIWELVNQQIFFTKDKKFVSEALVNFLKANRKFAQDLNKDIFARFNKVSEEILSIDQQEYPCFVFKNTSVDDAVLTWFEKYDGKNDEYIKCSLTEVEERICDFVVIENNEIKGWVNNLKYFNK